MCFLLSRGHGVSGVSLARNSSAALRLQQGPVAGPSIDTSPGFLPQRACLEQPQKNKECNKDEDKGFIHRSNRETCNNTYHNMSYTSPYIYFRRRVLEASSRYPWRASSLHLASVIFRPSCGAPGPVWCSGPGFPREFRPRFHHGVSAWFPKQCSGKIFPNEQ